MSQTNFTKLEIRPSSRIEGMEYDRVNLLLKVTFKGNKQYLYRGVSNFTVQRLLEEPSLGKGFQKLIINKGYEYDKLS